MPEGQIGKAVRVFSRGVEAPPTFSRKPLPDRVNNDGLIQYLVTSRSHDFGRDEPRKTQLLLAPLNLICLSCSELTLPGQVLSNLGLFPASAKQIALGRRPRIRIVQYRLYANQGCYGEWTLIYTAEFLGGLHSRIDL